MDCALLFAEFSARHRHRRWPRQRLLHECLRAAIRTGQLAPASRLPGSRALALELGLARNTVLYAYEQLASEGFVESDRRGTVVARLAARRRDADDGGDPATARFVSPSASTTARTLDAASETASVYASAQAPDQASAIAIADTVANTTAPAPVATLSRRASDLRWSQPPSEDAAGAFLPGVPALDEFPLTLWRRMLERAWRSLTPAQLNYADAAGEMALREAVADHLRAARGVSCEAAQVLITDGTQDSLDLCLHAFADAGQRIWLENPGYGGALAASRAAGLEVAGIALDDQGMAPQPADWRERAPRLIYVTPSHQYPSGCVMTLGRRLELLDGARAAGALIIEDDYDSEFRHDGAPLSSLQGLSADAPVLYLGTFSKTMFPGLRIGFMVAPRAHAPALLHMAAQIAPRGRSADQLALAEFLRGGQFARHLRRMRRLYRQRRDALLLALQRHMGDSATVHGASAGMHLALRLNDARLSDVALAAQARAHGLSLYALSSHQTGRAHGWNGFLLGYAQVPAERMDALVRQLAALVDAGLAAARPSAVSGVPS